MRALDALKKAKRHVNPAVQMYVDLQQRDLTLEEWALAAPDIVRAMEKGEKEATQVEAIVKRLKTCRPIPASEPPSGF